MKQLSIIIVNYKVKDLLDNCLKSIFDNSKNIELDIIVVDNYSQDGSIGMIRKKYPQINLISSEKNLGFAKANNFGFEQSKYDYVLLLNPDMQILPHTLENMINWMDKNPQASIAGCHLIDQNRRTLHHIRRFPTLGDQLAITLKLPHILPSILNKYLRKDFDYSKAAKVDSIRGAFFMTRKKVYKELKGLDEKYFIWFEEVDFCQKVYQSGGEVGKSFEQLPRGLTQKYFKNSMLKYFQKWHPLWQWIILQIAWIFGTLIGKINIKSKVKT